MTTTTLDLFQPDVGQIQDSALEQHAEMAYLRYAISVIRDRALPAVSDGQKPSQRRILYAMYLLGLLKGAKAVKCARIVGEVIGKFHPHGDTAAYDTLVRMAQDFASRYPLIEGQGNFGSRDGANPAAMRYTEARLTPFAELVLSELRAGTVDYGPNYDGSFEEPRLLPARLPLLLLNGVSGIAVGMATEIPSHNLTEVAQALSLLLTKPASTLTDVLQVLPGPDFPGGGQLISDPAAIRAVYESGRGSLRVRARWTVEQLARKDWQIVVHELPHGVSAQTVLTELDALTDPKIKAAQKKLSQKQLDDKQTLLAVLDRVRDEAGRNYAVRLVIEPRSNKQAPDELMALLLAKTSLEVPVAVNLVVLGLDGAPKQSNLLDILQDFLKFRLGAVARRTQHRLEQVASRLEILGGRLICLLNIDEVLRVIREADDPASELIARFQLTDKQAQDILELRLRQLSRLEHLAIDREIQGLQAERSGLTALITDPAVLRKQVGLEIKADAKQFGDARRTLIEPSSLLADACAVQAVGGSEASYLVRLSDGGWLHTQKQSGQPGEAPSSPFKAGDLAKQEVALSAGQDLHVLAAGGRIYSLTLKELLQAGKQAVPFASLRDGQGAVVALISGPPGGSVLFAQSAGYGFVCSIGDLVTRQRAGKAFVTLAPGSVLLPPVVFGPTPGSAAEEGEGFVVVWSGSKSTIDSASRGLIFPIAEVKVLAGGGKGVQLLALNEDRSLVGAQVVPNLAAVASSCPILQVAADRLLGHRAGAGTVLKKGATRASRAAK